MVDAAVDEQKQAPTQEPIERLPQFLLNMEDRMERIRAKTGSFVRQFEELDSREKHVFITTIQEEMNALVTQVLGLARTRGEEDELKQELTLYLKPRSWKTEQGKFDYGRYVASINNALSSLQVFLERNSLLLTMQPIPADFSQQLIEGILDDMKSLAEEEARVELDRRHAEQVAKYHELEAAGKLTPEKLATLSEDERRLMEQLAIEKFDEGLDELGEEKPEVENPEMDNSEQGASGQKVKLEINDEEVD